MPTNTREIRNCDDCGNEINLGDEYERISSNRLICVNCVEERANTESEEDNDYSYSNSINSYGYKPSNKFHHADGSVSNRPNKTKYKDLPKEFNLPYMGAELEAEAPDNSYLQDWAQRLTDETSGLVYAKEDCTINHGFEMVTHPMDLDYVHNHTKNWENVILDMRKAGWRAWDSSNCGFHIHLEKKSFINARHEVKFIYFIFKNKANMIKFAGRNSTYARFNLESFINVNSSIWKEKKPSIMEVVKGVQKNGDYVPGPYERNLAVNRLNENTYELRFFKPSLRYETLLSYFEFTHCMWAFTKDVTFEQVMKENALTTFDVFANYARNNKNIYPHLIERMHKRKVSTKPKGWDDINDDK